MYRSLIMSDISKGREEFLGLLVLRDRLGRRARKVMTEKGETLDLRAHRDLPVLLDLPGLLDPPEMGSSFDGVDYRDQMKRVQAQWPAALSSNLPQCLETPEFVAPEDSVAHQVFPVKRVKKDPKETLDPLDPPVIKAIAVPWGRLENRVPQDLTGREDPPDPLEKRETEGLKVLLA